VHAVCSISASISSITASNGMPSPRSSEACACLIPSSCQDWVWLVPEHPDYAPLEIHGEMGLVVWGVVAHVVHSF
jgi:hypothetical protein